MRNNQLNFYMYITQTKNNIDKKNEINEIYEFYESNKKEYNMEERNC